MQEDKSRTPILPLQTQGKTESTTLGGTSNAQHQLQQHPTLNSNGGISVNSTNQGNVANGSSKQNFFLGFKGILKKNFTQQQQQQQASPTGQNANVIASGTSAGQVSKQSSPRTGTIGGNNLGNSASKGDTNIFFAGPSPSSNNSKPQNGSKKEELNQANGKNNARPATIMNNGGPQVKSSELQSSQAFGFQNSQDLSKRVTGILNGSIGVNQLGDKNTGKQSNKFAQSAASASSNGKEIQVVGQANAQSRSNTSSQANQILPLQANQGGGILSQKLPQRTKTSEQYWAKKKINSLPQGQSNSIKNSLHNLQLTPQAKHQLEPVSSDPRHVSNRTPSFAGSSILPHNRRASGAVSGGNNANRDQIANQNANRRALNIFISDFSLTKLHGKDQCELELLFIYDDAPNNESSNSTPLLLIPQRQKTRTDRRSSHQQPGTDVQQLIEFQKRNSNEERYKNAGKGGSLLDTLFLANMKSIKNLDRLRRTSKIKNLNIAQKQALISVSFQQLK